MVGGGKSDLVFQRGAREWESKSSPSPEKSQERPRAAQERDLSQQGQLLPCRPCEGRFSGVAAQCWGPTAASVCAISFCADHRCGPEVVGESGWVHGSRWSRWMSLHERGDRLSICSHMRAFGRYKSHHPHVPVLKEPAV